MVNELNNVTKEEEIQDYEISEISDVTYNGQEQKPYPLLIDEEGNLLSKEDYTVEYRNNINAGTAEVIIKIKSTGQVIVKEFTIKKRDVKIYIQKYSCTWQDPIPEFSYTTEGLINPDDLKLVRFLLDGEEVPPVTNMPVGAYTISIEFEPNENYNLIIYPGVLTVTASPVPGNSTTPTPVNGDRDF